LPQRLPYCQLFLSALCGLCAKKANENGLNKWKHPKCGEWSNIKINGQK